MNKILLKRATVNDWCEAAVASPKDTSPFSYHKQSTHNCINSNEYIRLMWGSGGILDGILRCSLTTNNQLNALRLLWGSGGVPIGTLRRSHTTDNHCICAHKNNLGVRRRSQPTFSYHALGFCSHPLLIRSKRLQRNAKLKVWWASTNRETKWGRLIFTPTPCHRLQLTRGRVKLGAQQKRNVQNLARGYLEQANITRNAFSHGRPWFGSASLADNSGRNTLPHLTRTILPINDRCMYILWKELNKARYHLHFLWPLQ